MIRTDYAVRTLQAVAAVLGLSLLLWTSGVLGLSGTAQAAQVTNLSDTLSDSAPSTVSDHTISFTTENGLSQGDTIVVTFDPDTSLFDLGSITVADIDLATGSPETDQTLAGAAGATTWGVAIDSGADTITFTTPDNYGVPSSTPITIYVGRVGPNAAGTENQITNPNATGTYDIQIGGTMQDSGETKVAIVAGVTLSASVDTSFDFTVSGVASGATVNTSPTTTASTTNATTLPFGELTSNQSATLAHDLQVVTNAANGFSVTVEQSGDLQSSTGATIDSFIDGAYTDTPSEWTSPSATVGDDTTYGHWGLTSDDPDFSATADRWVAASTSPVTIFQNTGVTDGTQTGTGTTRVGYQVQVSPLQEAGNDYSTELTYIATAIF